MKKTISLCAAILVLLLLLSSCFAGNTTTDYARNHVYKLGDVIRFYDETSNRDLLGTLTFVSVHVLSEDEFTLQEQDGKDANGEPVYKEVTYRQIVQIDYMYQSITGKRPRSFSVHDAAGGQGALNPDAPYQTIPVDAGVSSLIAALPARSKSVRAEVFFTGVLTPNAAANLAVGKEADIPAAAPTTTEQADTTQNQTQPETQPESALLEARLDEQRQSILLLDAQLTKKQNQVTVLVVLLSVLGSVFLMFLLQQFRGRKKP